VEGGRRRKGNCGSGFPAAINARGFSHWRLVNESKASDFFSSIEHPVSSITALDVQWSAQRMNFFEAVPDEYP
jgi:hypothetical protein